MRKFLITFLQKLKDRAFMDSGQADPTTKRRNIAGTHWLAIPNVSKFSIELKDYNTLLEYVDLKKRNAPTFEYEAYRNKPYNIYMANQISRLKKLRSDPVKYFKVARHLMRHSKIFRVSAINKCMVN